MDKEKIYLKGSFWTRLAAYIIDEIIILVILFLLIFTLTLLEFGTKGLENVIYYLVSIFYGAILIWRFGATLGKKLLKLKVVTNSYQPVSIGRALLRESIGKFISGIIFSLGFFTALIDKRRQTWHDKIAKTYVVSVNQQGEMIPTTEETVTRKQKVTFWVLFLLAGFPIVALSIFVITYLFIVQPHEIRGSAMNPNYTEGQYYLTSKIAYRKGNPQRGDVIVFAAPNNPDVDYIKRIIGLPGDTVELRGGRVYINEKLLEEPYLTPNTDTNPLPEGFISESQKVTVPQNQYFVLGDNRTHSSDSREWGFAPQGNIVGQVAICYWKCSSPNFIEKLFSLTQTSPGK